MSHFQTPFSTKVSCAKAGLLSLISRTSFDVSFLGKFAIFCLQSWVNMEYMEEVLLLLLFLPKILGSLESRFTWKPSIAWGICSPFWKDFFLFNNSFKKVGKPMVLGGETNLPHGHPFVNIFQWRGGHFCVDLTSCFFCFQKNSVLFPTSKLFLVGILWLKPRDWDEIQNEEEITHCWKCSLANDDLNPKTKRPLYYMSGSRRTTLERRP